MYIDIERYTSFRKMYRYRKVSIGVRVYSYRKMYIDIWT